jgi:hypothetical protein
VIDKVATYHELYGISRWMLHMDWGGMPQADLLAAVEHYAIEVAPVLRGSWPCPSDGTR